MDNFERFVRTAVADNALCESIVAGYHAYLEADMSQKDYGLGDWDQSARDNKAKVAADRKKAPGDYADNTKSVHHQDGWAAAQAKYGKKQKSGYELHQEQLARDNKANTAKKGNAEVAGMSHKDYGFGDWDQGARDKKAKDDQAAAVAKANAAKKGNAEVAGRTAGGDRGASRVSSTGAGTTPHDPSCGVKGQQAPKSVAAAMPSKKRTVKARPAGNKPAQNAAPAAVAASQSTDRKPEGNVEAANKQVAAKAREFFGKANDLWRKKYGEEPPAEQKLRNQQAALKQAGQWYKNYVAANHQDTGLRVAGTNGDGKAKIGKRRGSERFHAMLKQGDEAMENVKKGLSNFTSDDNG